MLCRGPLLKAELAEGLFIHPKCKEAREAWLAEQAEDGGDVLETQEA
jgi:hypothetical protein